MNLFDIEMEILLKNKKANHIFNWQKLPADHSKRYMSKQSNFKFKHLFKKKKNYKVHTHTKKKSYSYICDPEIYRLSTLYYDRRWLVLKPFTDYKFEVTSHMHRNNTKSITSVSEVDREDGNILLEELVS